MIHQYEKLEVWKRASQLAVRIYIATRNFKNYSFSDQMRRAAISIPSNIAEGSERGSSKDFARFLKIAKGSPAELRTQLFIHQKICILNNEEPFEEISNLLNETKEIASMLHGLIQSVHSKV